MKIYRLQRDKKVERNRILYDLKSYKKYQKKNSFPVRIISLDQWKEFNPLMLTDIYQKNLIEYLFIIQYFEGALMIHCSRYIRYESELIKSNEFP